MAVFSVEGKLGTGKTKFCVWRAQDAIRDGRKVATNVDILPHVLNPSKPGQIIRIPDKPTGADLDAIGNGNPDSYDEEKNGLLILDELGTWLNSRSFQEPGRAAVLDWLIHARKHGWDVYLIVQDASMIDRQVRDALIEYQIRCMRMDKVRIPFLGHLFGLIKDKWAYLPKFHMATSRVGLGINAIVADRWQFQGTGLHAAYDTRQIFRTDYPHASHSVLPPWDYLPPVKLTIWQSCKKRFALKPVTAIQHPVKPKDDLTKWLQRLPPDKRAPFMRKHGLT